MNAVNFRANAFEQETQLAALAFGKLVGMLQGALTIGLPGMVTGVPEPGPFFDEQFRRIEAHALVLHSISGHAATVVPLREKTASLLAELGALSQAIGRAEGRLPPPLDQPIERVFAALAGVAGVLRLDTHSLDRTRATIGEFLPHLERLPAELAARGGEPVTT